MLIKCNKKNESAFADSFHNFVPKFNYIFFSNQIDHNCHSDSHRYKSGKESSDSSDSTLGSQRKTGKIKPKAVFYENVIEGTKSDYNQCNCNDCNDRQHEDGNVPCSLISLFHVLVTPFIK